MTSRNPLLAASITLIAAPAALGQSATFEWLDQALSADDMSPDGRWVVGIATTGGGYVWSRETGYTLIGGQNATAVSDDGTVVLGNIDDPEGIGSNVAGRWTQATGWVSLGALPNALGCPSRSDGYELSADGSVAVGLSWDGCNGRGFRWTEATGILELEPLANGNNRASVVSGDGTLAAGFAQGSFDRTPAIWTADTTGQLLDPPNGDVSGEVNGISDDGTILLGVWNGKPFRLEEGEPIEIFNPVLTGWTGIAMDIADDQTIVGFDILLTNRRAWIRPNGGPAVNLHDYLESLGVTGLPNTLEVCQAISANGNVIIGHNSFANGWRVNLCTNDLSGNGSVDFADILEIIGAWGPCSGCDEDLDGSGDVGFGDILAIIGGWGPCP